MNRTILRAAGLGLLWLSASLGIHAEDTQGATVDPSEAGTASSAADVTGDRADGAGEMIFPGRTRSEEALKKAAEARKEEPSSLGFGLLQAFLFLSVLGLGAFFGVQWLRNRKGPLKGRIGRGLGESEHSLRVEETKMLGNKQFLVVVSYGGRKMLIGVGPGLINHLCYLNNGFDENLLDEAANETEQTQPEPVTLARRA
jgi:flagellar biogenesis protein FliO